MIIICPCGKKQFEVNDNLIPPKGRLLKCGSCDQTWFYDHTQKKTSSSAKSLNLKETSSKIKHNVTQNYPDLSKDLSKKNNNKKNYELTKYKEKSNYTFGHFLSYILVGIISFAGVIIIIDTFNTPLYRVYPGLELILFNLFETLKDINLFIKDLI